MFNYKKFSAVEQDEDDFMKELDNLQKTPKTQRRNSSIFNSVNIMADVEEDSEFIKQLNVFPNKEEQKDLTKQIDAFTVLSNIGKTLQKGATEKEKPRVISHNFMQNINSLITIEEKKENNEKKEKRLEVLHHISEYFSGPEYLLDHEKGEVNWTPDLILQDNPELDSAIDSILDKLSSCDTPTMLSSSSEIMNHLSQYFRGSSSTNTFSMDFDKTTLESPTFDEMELDSEEFVFETRNKIPPFM
jgi:hypothetical protein